MASVRKITKVAGYHLRAHPDSSAAELRAVLRRRFLRKEADDDAEMLGAVAQGGIESGVNAGPAGCLPGLVFGFLWYVLVSTVTAMRRVLFDPGHNEMVRRIEAVVASLQDKLRPDPDAEARERARFAHLLETEEFKSTAGPPAAGEESSQG